ncbi:potassium channel family protein [Heyndrickxia oleronia]|mgnify:CR=1 FL=1|uniref:potassium channel family protein n=1 Tax=Heyndrickxia oleronia TaxID=38875 RepID=UPI001C0F280C|nr:TrkA family potassium uptake protein [Heyndrickxia oleronia]MBU5211200.1 TrkA family potassium uptake protein [Heyndrickxia oleronia]
MKRKSFAVFGLGRFGGTLVKEFHDMDIEVIAIDKNEEKVNDYMNLATFAVCADVIDETILNHLGIRNVDHAFVSFGDNMQSSILTSMLLKEIGVPQVWAKAQNDYHSKVLKKIGVDRVIHPERDVAKRIAHHIVSDKMIDFIELSKDHSMVEIVATKKIDGCSLGELDIRANYGCTIVGIQRNGSFVISPSAEEVVTINDVLIVIGSNKDISLFEKKGV